MAGFTKERRKAMARALTVYTTESDPAPASLSWWLMRDDGRWLAYAPAIGTRVMTDRECEAFLYGLKAGRFQGGV